VSDALSFALDQARRVEELVHVEQEQLGRQHAALSGDGAEARAVGVHEMEDEEKFVEAGQVSAVDEAAQELCEALRRQMPPRR